VAVAQAAVQAGLVAEARFHGPVIHRHTLHDVATAVDRVRHRERRACAHTKRGKDGPMGSERRAHFGSVRRLVH
jgi:hypothetical protein